MFSHVGLWIGNVLRSHMCRILRYICLLIAVTLSACVSIEEKDFTLESALLDKRAITIPMRIAENGLIILEGVKINDQKLDMVMDTGATQSAIFRSALNRANINVSSENDTMVHGMTQSQFRRVVTIPKLEIGPLSFSNKPMVDLDNREPDIRVMDSYDGLIGMDILSSYQIYVSPTKNELWFISNDFPVTMSPSWSRLFLNSNPFQTDDRALHFLEIRMAGKNTPALLDTGAEFSAMNWTAANYPQVRRIRKKLREKWELQGAVGQFEPTTKVKLESLRSGQIFWKHKEFVILEFDSLNVLGVHQQPFIIAGMNLFGEDAIFIDFERNFLAIVPDKSGDSAN